MSKAVICIMSLIALSTSCDGPKNTEQAALQPSALFPVKHGGKWGYIDKTGKIVIEPRFHFAGSVAEGRAPVKLGKKWGYIDTSGKIAVNPMFDLSGGASDGLINLAVGDRLAYLCKNGKVVIYPQIDEADRFSEGLAD